MNEPCYERKCPLLDTYGYLIIFQCYPTFPRKRFQVKRRTNKISNYIVNPVFNVRKWRDIFLPFYTDLPLTQSLDILWTLELARSRGVGRPILKGIASMIVECRQQSSRRRETKTFFKLV